MNLTEQLYRRKTREINVGGLKIGGNNPVRVQSMTTPKTDDVDSVVKQIKELEVAGCELVRVTVNNQESADALPDILRQVRIPVIASGGAGKVADFAPAVEAGAGAVLAASVFHFGDMTIGDVKAALSAAGYPVR